MEGLENSLHKLQSTADPLKHFLQKRHKVSNLTPTMRKTKETTGATHQDGLTQQRTLASMVFKEWLRPGNPSDQPIYLSSESLHLLSHDTLRMLEAEAGLMQTKECVLGANMDHMDHQTRAA